MKKLIYGFAFGMLIMLSASTTRADAIDDPKIVGGGGGSCPGIGFDVTSSTQSFSIPAIDLYPPQGPCVVDFTNETGGILTGVTLDLGTAFAGVLSCGLAVPSPFTDVLQPTASAPNSCTFFGASIPDEGVFGLTFGSTGHPFCAPGSSVTAAGCTIPLGSLGGTFHPTPEPASVALIGTGLAAWVARRKKLGNKLLAS